MTTVTETKPSWTDDAAVSPSVPEDKILQELEDLALGEDDVTARAASLFNFLRKISDKDRAVSYLTGIQLLIRRGEPAGNKEIWTAIQTDMMFLHELSQANPASAIWLSNITVTSKGTVTVPIDVTVADIQKGYVYDTTGYRNEIVGIAK